MAAYGKDLYFHQGSGLRLYNVLIHIICKMIVFVVLIEQFKPIKALLRVDHEPVFSISRTAQVLREVQLLNSRSV